MTVTQGLHFDQIFHRKYYWLECHKGQKWLNYHRGHNWLDDQRNIYRLNVIEEIIDNTLTVEKMTRLTVIILVTKGLTSLSQRTLLIRL